MTNLIASKASPSLVYHCSMDLACTYAMRRPALARELALDALRAAVKMQSIAFTQRANELLIALAM
jgi:hypothetical protein